MTTPAWQALEQRMVELRALRSTALLLLWDEATQLPARGAAARVEQNAAVQALLNERTASPALGDAIETAAATELTEDERAGLRVLRREHARAVALPSDVIREEAIAQGEGLAAWREARERADFSVFAPFLSRILRVQREKAAAWTHLLGGGPQVEPYDALLDEHEEGMRVARLLPLFEHLVGWLTPFALARSTKHLHARSCISGHFEPTQLFEFGKELLGAIGFDFDAGRVERSAQAFTAAFDPGDVRLSIRAEGNRPLAAVFSALHEGAHALYEQGLPIEHRRSMLCGVPSAGLHESQARLWETMVGRSRGFWIWALPRFAARFPQLADVSLDSFLGELNRVEPSLLRVHADEVTYNLHIAIRVELELALFRGQLAVGDLPDAWSDAYARRLGVRPTNDEEGVLQEVHWAYGGFADFQAYAIGNLYAASLYRAARRELPGLEDSFARGEFHALRDWMREKVHRRGRRDVAEAIVRDATGSGLSDDDFGAYLVNRYPIR